MELITFILTSFGITYIIVYGGIFKNMREYLEENYPFFGDLVGCPMCFGFWSGVLVSIFYVSPTPESFIPYGDVFFDGCLSSASCWILHVVCEYFESFRKDDD